MAENDLLVKVQTAHHCCTNTHFHIVGHQDLAGLLDHWLWLELLFTEGMP